MRCGNGVVACRVDDVGKCRRWGEYSDRTYRDGFCDVVTVSHAGIGMVLGHAVRSVLGYLERG